MGAILWSLVRSPACVAPAVAVAFLAFDVGLREVGRSEAGNIEQLEPRPASRREAGEQHFVAPCGSARADAVVAAVVLELGEAEGFEDGGYVVAEAASEPLLQAVPANRPGCRPLVPTPRPCPVSLAYASRRGSVLAFALADVLSARQMLWTGPVDEAVHDARTALDALPAGSIYRSSAAYCVASGLLEQRRDDEAAAVLRSLAPLGPAERPFFAAWQLMAEGRLRDHRGDDAGAVETFLAVGRSHAALLIVNPAVLPWRSEAALGRTQPTVTRPADDS